METGKREQGKENRGEIGFDALRSPPFPLRHFESGFRTWKDCLFLEENRQFWQREEFSQGSTVNSSARISDRDFESAALEECHCPGRMHPVSATFGHVLPRGTQSTINPQTFTVNPGQRSTRFD